MNRERIMDVIIVVFSIAVIVIFLLKNGLQWAAQ